MTDFRNQHSARAVHLLVNYFEAIAKKAGMRWDSDYTAEIHEAVDYIVSAAVEAMREDAEAQNARLVDVVRRLDAIEEGSLKGLEDSIAHLKA